MLWKISYRLKSYHMHEPLQMHKVFGIAAGTEYPVYVECVDRSTQFTVYTVLFSMSTMW